MWELLSFLGEAQGLCCAQCVLSPPGLLLLREAVRAGVLADPHGPVCQLPGNGFANAVGAPWSQGLLWERQRSVGQSGRFRCSEFWKARLPPGRAEPCRAFCSRVPCIAGCLSRPGVQCKGDGSFYKRMTLVLVLGSKIEHAGKEQEQFWPKMAAPGKVSAWKARSFLLPLSKREAEWEQGSVNMTGCSLLERIAFYTMSPGS